MKIIRMIHGEKILVDNEDFAVLSQSTWSSSRGYARSGRAVLMHRLLLNAPRGMDVDHINGNPLDNRKTNLRLCSHAQNGCNQKIRKNNSSGYKGVSWEPLNRKWRVRIMKSYKYVEVGLFADKTEAAIAYNGAATLLHGEFAFLNSI